MDNLWDPSDCQALPEHRHGKDRGQKLAGNTHANGLDNVFRQENQINNCCDRQDGRESRLRSGLDQEQEGRHRFFPAGLNMRS